MRRGINKKVMNQNWQRGFYILLLLFIVLNTQAQTEGDGADLYQSLCSACHGGDLLGARGPNLLDENWTNGNTREAIAAVIQNGVSAKGMPGFNRVLNKNQINHIVDYIFQMRHTSASEPLQKNNNDTLETLDYVVNVKEYVRGLEMPWSLEFIDANTALITERPGRLRIVEKGHLREQPIADTPKVYHPERAQGGLLDIALHPDYKKNGWIYMAYTDALESVEGEEYLSSMLCIVRGRIRDYRWVDEEIIYKADSRTYTTSAPYHYGSRIVFDSQGHLYFSVGDRYRQDNAQDLQRPNGKIHRLHADGSIPKKNPFAKNNNALKSIYSFGHRNPQGLAIHPDTGELWAAEHGPKGGDELNLIEAGGNHGWPKISYGINYDGTVLTPHRRKPGMVQPSRYWRPSIAVSGITFYNGQLFPLWKNKLLLGALKYEELRLLDIDDGRVMHEEILLKNLGRVREAVVGPEGAIYVILDEPGRIVQLTPRQERLQ